MLIPIHCQVGISCVLKLSVVTEDKYMDVAFSEDQLLRVPLLPEGTEFQTECIYRHSAAAVAILYR